MVCDWWISIHFVFLHFTSVIACDHQFGQSLTCLLWRFFLIFLIHVPLRLHKNSTNHGDFLHYSWAVYIHSQFSVVGQAWWVHIAICITCNQPHIFVATALKSPTLPFTHWALFAMKWAAIAFSLDCSKFLCCWLWFQQTQTLPKHFQLDLHKCHNSFFIHPLEKWFAMYFELTLSTILCNFIV